jgi:hypothetical protein
VKRVDKPIRLYILTIFIVIVYGLLPFASVFFIDSRSVLIIGPRALPFNGSIAVLLQSDGETSLPLVFVSLFLCVFSAGSAIWAFAGDRLGRVSCLSFVTTNVVWWTGIVVYALTVAEAQVSEKLGWVFQILIPPFWLAAIWWNFTRPDLNAYYDFKSSTAE